MMTRYGWLQTKRVMRVLPYVLLVTVVLAVCLALLLSGMLRTVNESEERQRFEIGIVGDTDNIYIDLGKSALESLDSTRFSVEMTIMTETQAQQAIQKGELLAYVVLPEGFVDAILYGEVRTIRYVTTAGSVGIASIVKEEVTRVIMELLTHSQKGVYGLEHALKANGETVGGHVTAISLEYADFVFDRAGVYSVEELGISDGLDLLSYYFCSMTVLFLYLMGLPYAVVFIKREYALERVLAAKGRNAFKQMLCSALAYVIAVWVLVALLAALLAICGQYMGMFTVGQALSFAVKVLPVASMIALCNLFLFEVSDSVLGGVLLQFFASLAMCYAAGCFFPIYSLPLFLQKLSVFLPTGLSRTYLSACVSGENATIYLLGLLAYTAIFFVAAALVRHRRIVGSRG